MSKKGKKKKAEAANQIEAAALEITRTMLEPRSFFLPMLAVTSDKPPEGDGWFHELKYDGHRTMALFDQFGRVRLWSRGQINVTADYPRVAEELTQLGLKNTYIDGEIAATRISMVPFGKVSVPFYHSSAHELPTAVKFKRHDAIRFFAFDILFADGVNLRPQPLSARKTVLEHVLKDAGSQIEYVQHIEGYGDRLFDFVCQNGGEGIVSKRATAGYHSGQSRNWQKTKCKNYPAAQAG